MSLEAMMTSCAVDAKENRYVTVTYILGAFLHADMNDSIHAMGGEDCRDDCKI